MYFICSKCKEKVCIPNGDINRFQAHEWECDLCYTVIASGRYQRNIRGSLTLFSWLGDALGDRIMSSAVKKHYLHENPDERVIFASSMEKFKMQMQNRPSKIFWADVTNQVYCSSVGTWFSVTNEARALAERGEYPFYSEKPVKPQAFELDDYVVIHARNIDKSNFKNMSQTDYIAICQRFQEYKLPVVIVGNDARFEKEFVWGFNYRELLTLPEIAWVLKHAKLFIGVDSGIAHLAATQNVPSIVYNFRSRRWVPISKNPGIYLQKKDSSIDKVLQCIDKLVEVRNVA